MKFEFEIKGKADIDDAIETMRKVYCCRGCKHFVQHYARNDKGEFYELANGHCKAKGVKRVLPENICDKFEKKEA